MAVPSSGLLRMSGLFSEFNEDDYTALNNDGEVILLSGGSSGSWGTVNTNSSSYPSTSNPDKMSEFYGYDHDATASGGTYASSAYASSPVFTRSACNYTGSQGNTYYHSGNSAVPAVNDIVYSNAAGTFGLSNGHRQIHIHPYNYNMVTVSSTVTSITQCST